MALTDQMQHDPVEKRTYSLHVDTNDPANTVIRRVKSVKKSPSPRLSPSPTPTATPSPNKSDEPPSAAPAPATTTTTTTPRPPSADIKSTDMADSLQKEAVRVVVEALGKHTVEKDIAAYVKAEFDRLHEPAWHCVIGRNFGAFVSHDSNHFIYFYVQNIAVMLFKTSSI